MSTNKRHKGDYCCMEDKLAAERQPGPQLVTPGWGNTGCHGLWVPGAMRWPHHCSWLEKTQTSSILTTRCWGRSIPIWGWREQKGEVPHSWLLRKVKSRERCSFPDPCAACPWISVWTRQNENVPAHFGFLKGPMLWKTEMKENGQWILSAVENNAVGTAPDHQDHVPTTPWFLFQNTSKHPDAHRILTAVTHSNCSFIQLLSRVCVVGTLRECKSQRYHSRLCTKGWWRNSFSSNRLKVYQNSYCAPAACSSTAALSGRGDSSSGFQDSLWTCSTLLLTSSLPAPPDDYTAPRCPLVLPPPTIPFALGFIQQPRCEKASSKKTP